MSGAPRVEAGTAKQGSLRIESHRHGSAGTLRLRGAVDVTATPELQSAFRSLADAGTTDLTVDLREVELIDSAALGTLVHMRRQLAYRGGALRLAGVPLDIRRLFAVTGLDRLFTLG